MSMCSLWSSVWQDLCFAPPLCTLMHACRPQTAAAGLGSRIPAPAATQRPATAFTTSTTSTSAQAAMESRRATGTAAAAVAAAAALPLPGGGSAGAGAGCSSVTLCSEEEWRLLPTRTQAAFPLDIINHYLRSLSTGRWVGSGQRRAMQRVENLGCSVAGLVVLF